MNDILFITIVVWLFAFIFSTLAFSTKKFCYNVCVFFCFLLTPWIFGVMQEYETDFAEKTSIRILILSTCILGFLLIKSIAGYLHAIKDATKLKDKLNILFNEPIFEFIVSGGLAILVLAFILKFLSYILTAA